MAKKKEKKAKKDKDKKKAKKKAKKKEKKGKKGKKKKQRFFPADINFKGNPAPSAGLPFFFGRLNGEYFLILTITSGRNYKIMKPKTWKEGNP